MMSDSDGDERCQLSDVRGWQADGRVSVYSARVVVWPYGALF